jgi:fumarate hydratase class I
VREEVVGPAGPTTATRMDKFTRQMLAETGLLGMIGKAERGPAAIEAIREFGRLPDGRRRRRLPRLQSHQGSRLLAFEDLGMEAIYEFEVKTCPSPSPSTPKAPASTKPAPPNGSAIPPIGDEPA